MAYLALFSAANDAGRVGEDSSIAGGDHGRTGRYVPRGDSNPATAAIGLNFLHWGGTIQENKANLPAALSRCKDLMMQYSSSLSYTCNLYLPEGGSSIFFSTGDFRMSSEFMLYLDLPIAFTHRTEGFMATINIIGSNNAIVADERIGFLLAVGSSTFTLDVSFTNFSISSFAGTSLKDCRNVRIERCLFHQNIVKANTDPVIYFDDAGRTSGGAVRIATADPQVSSNVLINASTFSSNAASSGGAISIVGQVSTEIVGSVFLNNSAVGAWGYTGSGGAVFFKNIEFYLSHIESCDFFQNSATIGGAISSTTEIIVETSNFEFNKGILGGSISIRSWGMAMIYESNFVSNYAVWGGAVDALLVGLAMIGCTFTDNIAASDGGAVTLLATTIPSPSLPSLLTETVYGKLRHRYT